LTKGVKILDDCEIHLVQSFLTKTKANCVTHKKEREQKQFCDTYWTE